MDIVIPFRHSLHEGEELRYVLRSIDRYFATAGKVWILGDRPEWLTAEKRVAEHVPHEAVCRPFKLRTPVRSYFLLTFLGSVIPELSAEYVQAMDDSVLLAPVDAEFLRRPRAMEDMSKTQIRGRSPWKDSLWRTHDTLLRLGYPAINYESHILHVMYRKWVWNAYRDFSDYVSEDPHFGFVGPTAIFNYRMKHEPFDPTWLMEEGKFIGFYMHGVAGVPAGGGGREIPGLSPDAPILSAPLLLTEQIRALCAGKTFLNFDDASFTIAMHQFLDKEFPDPSRYERADDDGVAGWGDLDLVTLSGNSETGNSLTDDPLTAGTSTWPEVIMPTRDKFPEVLNAMGLIGEGVEVGTLRGQFAETLLQTWQGKRLHCVDPWQSMQDDPNYRDINNVPQAVHDQNYAETQRRLARFGDRCQIHRLASAAAAPQFADASLDFVYLDARHYRAGVEEDLNLWARKIRPGGILSGHDYLDGVLPSGRFEVKSAVDAWAQARGLEIRCSGESVWRSWFIRMPV